MLRLTSPTTTSDASESLAIAMLVGAHAIAYGIHLMESQLGMKDERLYILSISDNKLNAI